MLPSGATATPSGKAKRASWRFPSTLPTSPANPAKVETTPAGVIWRMGLVPILGDVNIAYFIDRCALRTVKLRLVWRTINTAHVIAQTGDRGDGVGFVDGHSPGGKGGGKNHGCDQQRDGEFFHKSESSRGCRE